MIIREGVKLDCYILQCVIDNYVGMLDDEIVLEKQCDITKLLLPVPGSEPGH